MRSAAAALEGAAVNAVIVRVGARTPVAPLRRLHQHAMLRGIPLVLEGRASAALAREADGRAKGLDELVQQLTARITAQQAAAREQLMRRRLEVLLELTTSTTTGVPLSTLAQRATGALESVLGASRASAVVIELVDGLRRAFVFRGADRVPVDLAVSPWLRSALDTRQLSRQDGVYAQAFLSEPGDGVALVFDRSLALEQEERDFVTALGSGLLNALERSHAEQASTRARQALESAYVSRFKELQEVNRRLKAVDQRKNELLAVLSHDLRAPLNVLLGHSHILLTDGGLIPDLVPSAEAIQRTSRKVLELVESLLENSRESGERIVLFTKTMDVAETVQETVRDLKILAEKDGVRLRAEAPMSLPALGDELKIRQVLQNLVTNALSHAVDLKEIVVRAKLSQRPDGDAALVEVQDDGVVADPAQLLLSFERSTGLGLQICRDYVERHGGEIWVEPRPGRGASFTFTLPLRKAVDPKKDSALGAQLPLVLVADDDPVFVRACALAFAGHYRVEIARDGAAVVERVLSLQPDVLVMDVFMPRRDGLDVLRELKGRPETAALPVVLISGSNELAEKLEAHTLGAMTALSKPFPLSVLLARIGEALKRKNGSGFAVPGNDALTGVLDPVGVANRLDQELSRSVRSGRALTLARLSPQDVPDAAGTRRFAAVLSQHLVPPELLGHWGRGAFVLVLPETPRDAGQKIVDRLLAALAEAGAKYDAALLEAGPDSPTAEGLVEALWRLP